MVRCRGCGREQSEWAAVCTHCGAGLADAPVVRARMATLRTTSVSIGTGRRMAVVALVVVVGVAAWAYWRPGAPTATTPATTAPAPPAEPPRQGWILSTHATTGPRLTDLSGAGTVLIDLPSDPDPRRPIVVGRTFVVVASGMAWAIDPTATGSAPSALGRADDVIGLDPDQVWLVRGSSGRPFEIERVDLTGRHLSHALIPNGARPVAALADQLLVQTPDRALHVFDPKSGTEFGKELGTASNVLGSSGVLVAWAEACSRCPLHITNVAQNREVVVAAPNGTSGWTGTGALAPDGLTLAAFAASNAAGTSGPELVIVDTSTGRILRQFPGGAGDSGVNLGAAAWTPVGDWVFFANGTGGLSAYHPGDAGVATLPVAESATFAAA